MGVDCSRWYLKETKKIEWGGRETRAVSMLIVLMFCAHDSKSTSKLACAEACWAGRARTQRCLITMPY